MSISKAISTSIQRMNVWQSIVLPAVVASVSLSIAFIGALVLGQDSGIDGVNGFVETLSGDSGSFLGGLGLLAPLGFAFAAGMVSAVNPCGFAMLPAYLGLYLGTNEQASGNAHPIKHITKGLQVGASVTAGFIVLFGMTGIIIGLGARAAVVDILPWLGLTIGISLALTGSWMIGGGNLYTGFATRAASHIGNPSQVNVRGYFLFGLSYGTASLSCTLPIFLSVIGTSFAVSSIATSVGQFLLYALGMGTVILTLTLGIASFKSAMIGVFRKALPYVQPIGSWLMVLAGSYIVFYWLTLGGLL
jgi:cytochrome c-type biogenesis protein